MAPRKFHNFKTFKKHGWFHRKNPFNAMLKNRLVNTLGASLPTPWFPTPVLNQGEADICSEVGTYTQRMPVTGKTYIPGTFITAEQQFINNSNTTEFDAKTVVSTATLVGLQATDGTIDKPDAKLWIYPQDPLDFLDTVNKYISLFNAPVGVAVPWYNSYEAGVNGTIPEGEPQGLVGGHWTTIWQPDMPNFAKNKGSWGLDAPGSNQGFYEVPRDVFNTYWQGSGTAIFIKTNDNVVKTLDTLSDLYVKVIELLNLE